MAFRRFPQNLARIPRHHRGCMDDRGITAGVEIRNHQSSNRMDRTECGKYRGLSLVVHARKVLLEIATNRFGDFCEEAGIRSEEQCGFQPQCSTTDMVFIVRIFQELGRTGNTSL